MEVKKRRTSEKLGRKGFPISKFNWVLEVVALIISVFLLLTTFMVYEGYRKLKETSDNYIEWERQATQMEISSDYLTREVRLFVQNLSKKHIDNYFKEVKETLTREKVLDSIRETFSENSKVYMSLKTSFEESHELQKREYVAMRLAIESREGAESFLYLYDEVKNVKLPPEAEDMAPYDKYLLSHEYVNGEEYFNSKQVIENGVNTCIAELIELVQKQQDDATRELDTLLIWQRLWLTLFIVAVITLITVTTYQVIRPLNKAVPFIRSNSTIPVTGAEEFRILVKTYNRMHKMNQNYREKLAYKASHDALTGVLNRSGFEDIIRDVDLSDVALLIIDIDCFKKINDDYGHETGDRALEAVTQTIRTSFRSEDVICRMGGDEFAVIMWHMGPANKGLIDSKIKKANEELCKGKDGLPPMSLSVGVAFGAENSAEEIFHNADKALYQTKTNGRCGCTFYDPER